MIKTINIHKIIFNPIGIIKLSDNGNLCRKRFGQQHKNQKGK